MNNYALTLLEKLSNILDFDMFSGATDEVREKVSLIPTVEIQVVFTEVKTLLDAYQYYRESVDGYEIDHNGIITSPGKFEGESYWVPYFWHRSLDEGVPVEDDCTELFIDGIDKALFPEILSYNYIALYESNDGFVAGELAFSSIYEDPPDEPF